jgi:magnesium-transporting ATPase (P-type)
MSSKAYPYNRAEECSWQPEEVARHLASLAGTVGNGINSDQLLHHGWSSKAITHLRKTYGSNVIAADDDEESKHVLFQKLPFLQPVFWSLLEQMKEPLILMLLGSAFISIALGNAADAISIAIALLIVSLVAAVQEYRSEKALEKLNNLVPHTCTVLRDGRVLDSFPARELVVGDLVLLSKYSLEEKVIHLPVRKKLI